MNEDTEEFREEQLKRERDKHEVWFEDDCIQIYYSLEATDSRDREAMEFQVWNLPTTPGSSTPDPLPLLERS